MFFLEDATHSLSYYVKGNKNKLTNFIVLKHFIHVPKIMKFNLSYFIFNKKKYKTFKTTCKTPVRRLYFSVRGQLLSFLCIALSLLLLLLVISIIIIILQRASDRIAFVARFNGQF